MLKFSRERVIYGIGTNERNNSEWSACIVYSVAKDKDDGMRGADGGQSHDGGDFIAGERIHS